ncbi:MAG: hypothetical protein E7616_09425 [Ruminococcaceae bacterium]|nr:hypothetical protein [Oscillospiraceae bacterium]
MNKRNTVRRMAAVIFACLLFFSGLAFVGCGKKPAVLTLDGITIEEDIYRYWLAKYKNYYISQISEIGDNKESFEKLTEDGVTVGEVIEDEAIQYAKAMLCSLKLFDEYGLKLSSSEKTLVKEMIDDNILYLGGGDRAEFNQLLLDTYGFSIDRLEEILLLEQKVEKLTSYLIDGGAIGYTADELDAFYMENYYRVKIVFINTTAKPKFDAEGKVQTDILGNMITEPLTDEEKAAKKGIAEEIFEKAKNGENFDELVKKNSEFENKESYPNGYYISSYEFDILLESGLPKQLLLDSNNAKNGDVMMISDEKSGHYIVQKAAPEAGAYKKGHADAAQLERVVGNLLQTKYDALVDSVWDRIKVNEDLLAGISIVDIKRGLNIGKIS